MKGYTIKKIYVIVCDKCNEDITRPLGGDDVTTLEEARAYIAKHDKVFHPTPQRQRPRTYSGPYCDSALAEYPPEPQSHVRLQDRPGWDELVREASRRRKP